MARLFKDKGAAVISADRLAHEVFRKGHALYPKVRLLFEEVRGDLSRAKIAAVVFRDPGKRKALETLIHPYVFRRIQEEIRRTRKRILILEIPLLFESGFDRRCDQTLVVQAAPEKVTERLKKRGFTQREIKARWQAQMPIQKKIRRSDFTIDNSDGLAETRRQVSRIWKELNQSIERSSSKDG